MTMKQAAAAEHDSDQPERAQSEQVPAPQPFGAVKAPEVPLAGGLAFPIQRKVIVGGVADPAEMEAEQVARSVVTALRGNPGAAAATAQRSPVPTIYRHADHDHDHDHEDGRRKRGVADIHRCGEGCEHTTVHRCSDDCSHGMSGSSIINRAATIGAEGGPVDSSTETALASATGGGSAINDGLRTKLETVLSADLSTIRLHAGEQASQLNRSMSAIAFTHGKDIYFRDGLPDTATDSGLHLLAHELTHTVQQGTAPQISRTAEAEHEYDPRHDEELFTLATPISQRQGDDGGIHRHAAFEHYLLGQLQPKDLAKIPSVRKVANKKEQKENLKEEYGTSAKTHGGLDAGAFEKGDKAKEKEAQAEALHVIDQEMERLWKYKSNPEALGKAINGTLSAELWGDVGEVSKAKTKDRNGIESKDEVYQVPIVVLQVRGDKDETGADGKPKASTDWIIVSYSEMNTMPDLFGNPEAIKATPKKQVLGLLQGVRQQLYIELSNIRKELSGEANNKLSHWYKTDDDFKGAIGPRAQAVIEGVYEIRTESQVDDATKRKGEESEQYFAALERNACHFAPQSWLQWESYHNKAVAMAKKAGAATAELDRMKLASQGQQVAGNDKALADKEREAKSWANEAMLQNSFGEHYLQDSFASGHLIDKTQVMQWFTLWAEKDKGGMGTSASEQAQWAMAVHAAGHNLKSNPQMLHDKGVRKEFGGANDAANEIGMGIQDKDGNTQDDEIVFMMKWRAKAKAKRDLMDLTLEDAKINFGFKSDKDARATLNRLVAKKFVEFNEEDDEFYFEDTWTLDSEMINVINSDAPGASKGLNPFQKRKVAGTAYAATRGKVDKKGTGDIDENEAKAAAAEFNLASYNAMLSNSYVGAATKYFHDKFCKEGLIVKANGTDLGRIYGDANMLNAGGQKGVEWSATTSQWSREAIFDLINGKPEAHATPEIRARFPSHVVYQGTDIPVENFSKGITEALEKDLKDRDKWYKPVGALNPASSNKGRAAYKVMGGISDQGALNVAQLGHKGKDPF
jgi:hypothetical protein